MRLSKGIRKLALAGLLGIPALLVACSSGVPQADLDAAKQQTAAEQQKAAALQQQLTAAKADATKLQEQIAAKDKQLAGLKKFEGMTPYVWTTLQPTPTPGPTPTPRPAGFVPPTPAPPDAATVNAVFPFTFYIETLTGHQSKYGYVQEPSCVPNAQFKRGAHLVWRFEVFDTKTTKRVTSLDEPKIKVVLPHGEEMTGRYARRGGTGPWTWVAAWTVPTDYPLGTLDYQIVVTSKDGRTGTFDQDDVAIVNKERKIDSRVQIIE